MMEKGEAKNKRRFELENKFSFTSEKLNEAEKFFSRKEITFRHKENPSFTFIDLFAGIGGFRLSMQANGGECVFSSELKDYAIKVYKGYFGNETISGDITQIPAAEIPDFDFLLAGFPCQPFSSAGQRLGCADTRGTLFFEIERILKYKNGFLAYNSPIQK